MRRWGIQSVPLFFSAAAIWEIAIKRAQGKLDVPVDLLRQMERREVHRAAGSTLAHAVIAGALPGHHRDPFDRMLVAQAQSESLTLVTGDARIAAYDVPVLRARRPKMTAERSSRTEALLA